MLKRTMIAFAIVLCVGVATPSQAGWGVGADLGVAIPLDEVADRDVGYSLKLRVFHDWSLAIVKIGVEVAGSYHQLLGGNGASIARAMVGARAAVGLGLEPYIFSHVGYGSVNDGASGVAMDVGFGLSVKIAILRLGLQTSYNLVEGSQTIEWVDVSARIEFGF